MAASMIDFLNDYDVRVTDLLDPPVMEAVVIGAVGTTTYTYKSTFVTAVGQSLLSSAVSITNGNANLNGFYKNKLSVLNIPPSVKYVRFWKLVGATWYKLGDVVPSIGYIYDTGQATSTATLPATNTSGRPDVIAIGLKPGQLKQRITDMDVQAMDFRKNQELWDTVFKDGDLKRGCKESQVTGVDRVNSTAYAVGDVVTVDSLSQFKYRCTVAGTSSSTLPTNWPTVVDSTFLDGTVTWTPICEWAFTEGKMYLFGVMITVPQGTVLLTGHGTEVVGVTVEKLISTADDDIIQRAGFDERVPPESANTGPDWIYLQVSWSVDEAGQIPIKEFVEGVPKLVTIQVERSKLEVDLARRQNDHAGSFVVRNFPLQVVDHVDDESKLVLKVGSGKAYPNGFEVETYAVQEIPFNKGRVTKEENNSGLDPFSIPGGSATTTNDETFDVDGLAIKLSVGSGNTHTVTFSGDGKTAAQLVTIIENAINTYSSDPDYDLVTCSSADGYLQIRAISGKSLTLHTVDDDAYTVLGLTTGTYPAGGTRIYPINNTYIKTVTDLNYKTEVVEQVTHNGNTHIDLLANPGVVYIVGASITEADAHDHRWDYALATDFTRAGNTISFEGMGGAEPVAGATYYVCYQYNRNAIKGTRQLIRVIDAYVTKGTQYGSDEIVYTNATSITRVYDGTAVTGKSGVAKDVVELIRVNATTGQSQTQYPDAVLSKNSTGALHNTSTIDWSVAAAASEGGQPERSSHYYISFTAWNHILEGDYVSADSYDLYDNIEYFSTLYLRDCIDFRTTSILVPVPEEDTTLDYEYYLSRVDKLVLSDTGNFSLITGQPALSAPIPRDQTNLLTIAIISISPYTYLISDCLITSTEPLRITQKGIKELRDRIERLEYWKSVNDLEKEVANTPAGADSQGMFTDALTGYGRMDLQFSKSGIYHTAALDRYNRCLSLPAYAPADARNLVINDISSTNFIRRGNMLTLAYTPEVFDSQPYATVTLNAAVDFTYDNNNSSYIGSMQISPAVDFYVDSEQLPALNVDFDDNLAPLLEVLNPILAERINYGAWRVVGSTYLGNPYYGWHFHRDVSERTNTYQQLLPGSITQDLGSRVVDMSLVSMMRTVDSNGDPLVILFSVSGLLPNQEHAVSINGTLVNSSLDTSASVIFGLEGSHTYQGKTLLRSDNGGRITGKFEMPAGIQAGSVPVKVFYYLDPGRSFASTVYYGSGFVQTTQQTTLGMSSPEVRCESRTESRAVSEETVRGYYVDPIAQTFMVKDDIKYISEVGLFFNKKHATLPITVQIRDVLTNSIPGNTVYASATLYPEDIEISTDASAETIFEFEHVIGYSPGVEYSLVIMPNLSNTDYEVWTSRVGEIDVNTGAFVNSQTHDGVLFHSPNGRTWEPLTKQDLKMNIYKSNFENECQIVFSHISGLQACLIATAVEDFAAPGTDVTWAYSLNGEVWIPFRPDVDLVLEDIITDIDLRIDITSLGGSYQMVEQVAGIVFLLHDFSAYAVFQDQYFTDDLEYPNKVTCYMDLDVDSTNGGSGRSVTPRYSADDGLSWVELTPTSSYTPVAQLDPYYKYEFTTPQQATIATASNASPIVIGSVNHGFQNNAIVDIANVTTNTAANGQWRVMNKTANTFELYDAATGLSASTGNGSGTGGTIDMAEFSQMRPMIYLETDHQAKTPRIQNISFICSRQS